MTGAHDLARELLTARVADRAYQEAEITSADADIIELHDAFSVAELLYYEALRFCGFGEAQELLRAEHTGRSRRQPVNPGGEWLRDPLERDRTRIGLSHFTGGGVTRYDHAACSIQVLSSG